MAIIACLFSKMRAWRRSRAAFKKVINTCPRESNTRTYLVLDTASLHLVGKNLSTSLLGLGLVDVLHEHALVLENITLGLLVELVVPSDDPTHQLPPNSTAPPHFLHNAEKA